MKLAIALITALTLGSTLLHAQPARCDKNCIIGAACWGYCGGGCVCIQPEGVGTQGWCN